MVALITGMEMAALLGAPLYMHSRGEAAVESAQSSGDFKSAIAEFEKACALAPNWPNPFFNLGIVQENAGDFDGAIKNLKRYLELAPNANDAAEVKTRIYKLEYKKERSNIAGNCRVDQNESKAECDLLLSRY
jgi:tetratricopeptide (TPR) repeat protein